jgi:hypothetical protein
MLELEPVRFKVIRHMRRMAIEPLCRQAEIYGSFES